MGILNLTATDLEMFAAIGVGPELLSAANVHRVTDSEARQYVTNANTSQDLSGIAFPYVDPRSFRSHTLRLRRDHPDVEAGKLKAKYVSPYGDRRHLYFPPGATDLLRDVAIPVVFVEAEKSALALTALGKRTSRNVLAIATGGCWGWRGKIGKQVTPKGSYSDEKGPLPDLDLLAFAERDVVICFDANSRTNEQVGKAQFALADELVSRGAQVRIASLPGEDGVNGPDDFICRYGDEELLQVLDRAQVTGKVAEELAHRAIDNLKNSRGSLSQVDEAYRAIARVESVNARDVLAAQARKELGVPAQVVKDAICRERKRVEGIQEAARERLRVRGLQRLRLVPSEIISKLEELFEEHAHVPEGVPLLLALWAMNTWCFDQFDTTAYLLLRSATPQCGKTTVLQLLEQVVRTPIRTACLTPAVTYRVIEQRKPTLLVDEGEALAGPEATLLRSILNAAYKRGAVVLRCEGNDYSEIGEHRPYCPIAIALIGSLSGALLDRCIVVDMEKKPFDLALQPVRERVLETSLAPLREQLEAYALQAKEPLQAMYNAEAESANSHWLGNREGELFMPLLLHARLAGAEIEARAVEMARKLSRQKQMRVQHQPEFEKIRELLDVLTDMPLEVSPKSLAQVLRFKQTWGAELEGKHDGAAAVSIGRFLQNYARHRRDRIRGSVYQNRELHEKLRASLPDEPDTPPPPQLVHKKPVETCQVLAVDSPRHLRRRQENQ